MLAMGWGAMERPTDLEGHEICCDHEPFRCPAAGYGFEGSNVTLSEERHVRTIAHNNIATAWFTMVLFDEFVLVKVDRAENGVETYPLYLVHHEIHEMLGTFKYTKLSNQ
jgi:hypothetical protein